MIFQTLFVVGVIGALVALCVFTAVLDRKVRRMEDALYGGGFYATRTKRVHTRRR